MIIFLALVGAAEIISAVYNGAGHRWASMTANVLIAISAACGLFAQRQRSKQQGTWIEQATAPDR